MNKIVLTIGISLLASGAQARSINLNSSAFSGFSLSQIKNHRIDLPAPALDVELAGPRVTLLLNAEQSNQLNPAWPGFSVFGQPILLYEAGVRSFLVAHPNPPAGYNSVLSSPQPVFEKPGAVPGLNFMFEFHFPVNGTDTFAYRYRTADNPAQNVRTIVHERFHVYQQTGFKRVPYAKRSSEPDAQDLALAALEQKTLKSAIAAAPADASRYARQFLAVRAERYARQPDSKGQENNEERSEGLALYVDHLLMNRPEVAPVSGYIVSDISMRLDMFPDISDMEKSRYYGTGAAQGLLLDAAGQDWKARVAAGGSLRDELALAYPMTPGSAGSLLAEAKSGQNYDTLFRIATQKAADFQKAKAAAISEYENAPGTEWSVPSPRSLGFSAQSPQYKLSDSETLLPKLQMLDASTDDFAINFTDRPTILGDGGIRFHSVSVVILDGRPFTLLEGSYQFAALSVTDAGLSLSISKPGTLTVTGRKAIISYR